MKEVGGWHSVDIVITLMIFCLGVSNEAKSGDWQGKECFVGNGKKNQTSDEKEDQER